MNFWHRSAIPFLFLLLVLNAFADEKPKVNLPKELQNQPGRLLEAFPVQDASGVTWFVVRESGMGRFGTKSYQSILTAGPFSIHSGSAKPVWKLKDFNGNPLESIEYRVGSFQTMDVNLDGIQDVSLWYRKTQDGADPDTLKLFLYVLGKKHVIRGRIPKMGNDLDLYEKTVDPQTLKAPKAVLDSMISKWESIVKPEMDALRAETQD
jgi:hypothetical protein